MTQSRVNEESGNRKRPPGDTARTGFAVTAESSLAISRLTNCYDIARKLKKPSYSFGDRSANSMTCARLVKPWHSRDSRSNLSPCTYRALPGYYLRLSFSSEAATHAADAPTPTSVPSAIPVVVKHNKKFAVIDHDGKFLTEYKFDAIQQFRRPCVGDA